MTRKIFFILSVLFFITAPSAFAQIKLGQIVQQTLSTTGSFPNSDSIEPILSPDAKLLSFTSRASNLVNNDTSVTTQDFFIKNLTSSSLTLQSKNTAGAQGESDSFHQSVSFLGPNNQFVMAFQTASGNFLSSGFNPNSTQHVFLRFSNTSGFVTQLVSIGTDSNPANGDSKLPSIGVVPQDRLLRVAFQSVANNIVSPGVNPQTFPEILLAELKESKTNTIPTFKRISVSSSGEEANGYSMNPQISADAQFVVFVSNATNLVSEPNPNAYFQVYLYNVKTGALSMISKSKTGVAGTEDSGIDTGYDGIDKKIGTRISFNGRYISYITKAPNLVSGLTVGNFAVLRYDTLLGINEVVNISESGVLSNGSVDSLGISGDGRYIVFSDSSTNFITDNEPGYKNIFLKDMNTGKLLPVSRGLNDSAANADSYEPSIALNGFNGTSGFIAFASIAKNLTNSPTATFSQSNIFTVPITLPKPEFTNNAPIDLPPEVIVTNRNIKIQMQPFTIPTSLRATSKSSVKYDVTIIPNQSKNGPRKKITTKRTRVVSRNLKPGTYTTTYKASVIKNGKVKAKSGQSPKIQFTIS